MRLAEFRDKFYKDAPRFAQMGSIFQKVFSLWQKVLDKFFFLDYNIKVAGVAQSVVQLIRNLPYGQCCIRSWRFRAKVTI